MIERPLRRDIVTSRPVRMTVTAAGSACGAPSEPRRAAPSTAASATKTMRMAIRSDIRGPTSGWRSVRTRLWARMRPSTTGTTIPLATPASRPPTMRWLAPVATPTTMPAMPSRIAWRPTSQIERLIERVPARRMPTSTMASEQTSTRRAAVAVSSVMT
jgi:hypothetical protein